MKPKILNIASRTESKILPRVNNHLKSIETIPEAVTHSGKELFQKQKRHMAHALFFSKSIFFRDFF
jgi:hypothetical protein